MSRQYNIQNRTKRQLADLNKRVSNKKSRYRREKGIELNPLIQTKKPSDFTSRKEVEKYRRDMERFLDRKTQFVTNSSNKLFTTSTARKLRQEITRINERKLKEFNRVKKLQTQIKGKELGMTLEERLKMAPKNLFPVLTPLKGSLDAFEGEQDLKHALKNKYIEGFYRGDFIRRKDRQYKANFIESLQNELGHKSIPLQKKLQRMSIKDFMNVYYQTLGTIDIPYVYDKAADEDTRLDVLEQTFSMKIEENQ